MTRPQIAAVLLAAGQGVRMASARPKVLHEVGARSMLAHVMAAADAISPARMVVVAGDGQQEVGEAAKAIRPDVVVAVQAPPQGTGDAVAKALPALQGFSGLIVILYADTPLVRPATLEALIAAAAGGGAVLGFRPPDRGGYGRLVLDEAGRLKAIVEAKDASPDVLALELCNAGVMAVDAEALRRALPRLTRDNAKREYYLTDVVALARAEGVPFAVVEGDAEEVVGVNSRAELAEAEAIFQNRMRRAAMEGGATLIDPSTVYFAFDVKIGRDAVIEPGVFLGRGVEIGERAVVRAFSHLEGARLGEGCVVGPFARLRSGAELRARARIGNFVEVKEAIVGEDAKANHLTYIGDAEIGARANIGAGTITCNFDGFDKYRTEIGDDAFVGSNSALVAPVKVGRGAYIGSGSVITKDVEDDALAVARGRQADIKGWAARFRAAHGRKKR